MGLFGSGRGHYYSDISKLNEIPDVLKCIRVVVQDIQTRRLNDHDRDIIRAVDRAMKKAAKNSALGPKEHSALSNAYALIHKYAKGVTTKLITPGNVAPDIDYLRKEDLQIFSAIAQEITIGVREGLRHAVGEYAKEMEKLREKQPAPLGEVRDKLLSELESAGVELKYMALLAGKMGLQGGRELEAASNLLVIPFRDYHGKPEAVTPVCVQACMQACIQAERYLNQAAKML